MEANILGLVSFEIPDSLVDRMELHERCLQTFTSPLSVTDLFSVVRTRMIEEGFILEPESSKITIGRLGKSLVFVVRNVDCLSISGFSSTENMNLVEVSGLHFQLDGRVRHIKNLIRYEGRRESIWEIEGLCGKSTMCLIDQQLKSYGFKNVWLWDIAGNPKPHPMAWDFKVEGTFGYLRFKAYGVALAQKFRLELELVDTSEVAPYSRTTDKQ